MTMPETFCPRLGCLSTYIPRRCGLATFSHDLSAAIVDQSRGVVVPEVLAVSDPSQPCAYPPEVRFEIRQHEPGDYRLLADFVNARGLDLLLVQHEYGIFGGADGAHLLGLLRAVRMPMITTLHTILADPSPGQRRVMNAVLETSQRVVVMSRRGAELLRSVHGMPAERIAVIPHGIPDLPFVDSSFYKDQFGVEGRRVLLTFGLLSRGKGIEFAIEALPAVVARHPDVIYIVLGATHPKAREHEGESYRESLVELAGRLGVADNVRLVDRYVTLDELCQYLALADVYVTPYLGQQQAVSGTLAYAMGAGKPVVSTPYVFAEEVLAEERGILVPFRDSAAISAAVSRLLQRDVERQAIRKRAYLYSRQAVWSEVGRKYLELAQQVIGQGSFHRRPQRVVAWDAARPTRSLPEVRYEHLLSLTDDTGLLQHARFAVADRGHGYCTDDNARALIVALEADETESPARLRRATIHYLSFLQHALCEQSGRFRNFLSYDRRWLEEVGSEDSHGRAVAALGFAVERASSEGLRAAALHLFERALPATCQLCSMRSWAFAVRGVDAVLARYHGDKQARHALEWLAQRLFEQFSLSHAEDADDWMWPEDRLTYANAAMPHALLLAGQRLERDELVARGLTVLHWLLELQDDHGVFAPIGNQGWLERGGLRSPFDQQPIEAQLTVEACLKAWQITEQRYWALAARRAFDWFLGKNVLGEPLVDPTTGACRDGLQPGRVNQNQGAESTLAWLSALVAMRALEPATASPSRQTALGWHV